MSYATFNLTFIVNISIKIKVILFGVLQMMDKSHRELLEEHRAMFRQSVEVEQLLPFLLAGEGLTTQDIAEINKHKSREGKVRETYYRQGPYEKWEKCRMASRAKMSVLSPTTPSPSTYS